MRTLRKYQIRPCSVLTFDEDKEKDIINTVVNLKDRNKLGSLITHLLRIALEQPESYGTRNELNQVLSKLEELGVTPTRNAYFSQISKEVSDMKKKIDSIYDMAYKTYMLSLVGKHLASKEKADNILLSSFILERQVSELCMNIGVDNLNHTFASNKLSDFHAKAAEVMEVVIEEYDGLLNEIKSNISEQSTGNLAKLLSSIPAISNSENKEKVVEKVSEVKETTTQKQEIHEPSDDDIVELAERPKPRQSDKIVKPNADMAALLLNSMKPK